MPIAPSSPEKGMLADFEILIDLFVPNFQIESFAQLEDLRNHKYLGAVRELLRSNELQVLDSSIVDHVNEDLRRIKESHDEFIRVVEFYTAPMKMLPVVGSALEVLLRKALGERKLKRLREGHEWKLFFSDMARRYGRDQASVAFRPRMPR
jgi:hypothetical protein